MGLVALLIVLRLALPTIVQNVLMSQGSKYLQGQLVVGGVDLWLLSGAVALEDVALWPDGAVPAEGTPPTEPAFVAWKRAYVNVGWMALFSRVANLEDFELDGLRVNVARLHDGRLVLPDLRDLPPDEDEKEEEDDDSEPFGVLIDRAALLSAQIRVRDDVPGTPTYRELKLPSVEVKGLAINDRDATTPGHLVIQAGIGPGTIRIDASISEQARGFNTEAQIEIANLPLDQLHVHEPDLDWTSSTGRLNASVRTVVDPQARITASGEISVVDLDIDVANEEKPGMAWRQLAVTIIELDVAKQRVELALVSLDGASVLVRPDQTPPMPILPNNASAAEADDPGGAPASATGASDGGSPEPPRDDAPGAEDQATTTAVDEKPNTPDAADEATIPTVNVQSNEPDAANQPTAPTANQKPDAPDAPDQTTAPTVNEETDEPDAVDQATAPTADDRTDAPSTKEEGADTPASEDTKAPAVQEGTDEPSADPAPPTEWAIHLARLEVTDATADLIALARPGTAHIGKLSITEIAATGTHWKIGAVHLSDSSFYALLVTGAANVEIPSLSVTGLTSDPSEPIKVVGKLKEDAAIVDIEADVTIEPQRVSAKIDLENVPLGRYAELSGVSPVYMPTGTLQAALAIQVDVDTAHLAGQIAMDEIQMLTHDGKDDFSVAWETLSLDIRTFDAHLTDPEAPMQLELAELRLAKPNIRTTLTQDGIVLPTVRLDEAVVPVPTDAPAEKKDGTTAPKTEAPLQEAAPSQSAAVPEDPPASGDAPAPTADALPSSGATREEPPSDDIPAPVLRDGLLVQTESVGVDDIAEFAEPAANLPIGLVVDRLRIEDGTFRVVDRAVKPTFRGKMTNFQFDITGVELPADVPPTETVFEKMSLDLDAPGGAPIKVRAGTEEAGLRVDASIEKLPLAQFNPYVQQAAGYTVLEGAATIESSVLWAKDRYESNTDVTLRSLDVGDDKGGTIFRDYFGISISAALALLSDITGKIGLGIPLSGSLAGGADIGIGSIVGQALTKAILGAITSPLKLLGAVTMIGDRLDDITPHPITFQPGTTDVTQADAEHVDSLGAVLASTPAIKLELIGQAGPDDVRALQEAAVLRDMNDESGILGGIRNLASGGTRNAIREALEAGDTSTLSDEDKAGLDDLGAEITITDADLTKLATDRAEGLRQTLMENDGVPEDQLTIGAAQISREEGPSEVRVNLLSRA